MRVRVPAIARDTARRNADHPSEVTAAIERLACEIERNASVPAPRAPGPDVDLWAADHAAHAGETWLATEWFYAELAFYRELADACRFWETGRDPFAPFKHEELAGERPWSNLELLLAEVEAWPRRERLRAHLVACLWGNRVDLSYAVAGAGAHGDDGDLLVDEREAAASLLSGPGAHVHVVADNTGAELAADLALADVVLGDADARVVLHVKMQPMFVSDALAADVWSVMDGMRRRRGPLAAAAARLRSAFDARRFEIRPDPYWNGPRYLWDAPRHLSDALSSATVTVLKGDANYRRAVGDALWEPTTPLARACAYSRAPMVLLRTMKSDPVVGLPPGMAERLDTAAPRWRIDGQRGVLQTYVVPGKAHPAASSSL